MRIHCGLDSLVVLILFETDHECIFLWLKLLPYTCPVVCNYLQLGRYLQNANNDFINGTFFLYFCL